MAFACLSRLRRGVDLGAELRGLRSLFEAVLAEPSPRGRLVAVLSYLAQLNEQDAEDFRRLVRRELGPAVEREMESTYDKLVNQGRSEGHAQGLAEGRTEGRTEGLAEGRAEGVTAGRVLGALDFVRLRFGHVPEAVAARIRAADDAGLATWMQRIVDASSIDDLSCS